MPLGVTDQAREVVVYENVHRVRWSFWVRSWCQAGPRKLSAELFMFYLYGIVFVQVCFVHCVRTLRKLVIHISFNRHGIACDILP